jgi:hypothetical protein
VNLTVHGECVKEPRKERKRVSEEEKQSQRQRLTDEELFYDPHMDEEDEQWVKRQRMAYHNVKVSQKLKEEQDRRLAGQQPPSIDPSGEGAPGSTCSDEGGGGEREQRGIGAHSSGTPPKSSDAHLSCPACMTTVCIDCQQ